MESKSADGAIPSTTGKEALPIVLVTNDDGVTAPGLLALVDVLVLGGKCQVFVCAPDQDRSGVAHGITCSKELLELGPVEVAKGIQGYETSGTPADCVSVALSGELFPWKVPALVISGINKGFNTSAVILYSGTVAAAKEAAVYGVPSMAISLDWNLEKGSSDEDYKAAAIAVLPLIHETLHDSVAGSFPKELVLNVNIPLCISSKKLKGFKVIQQGTTRYKRRWVSLEFQARRTSMYGVKEQAMASQLAQMGMAAAAVGAAKRTSVGSFWASKRQNEEIEAVGTGKTPGGPAGGPLSPAKVGFPAATGASPVATSNTERKQFRCEASSSSDNLIDDDAEAAVLASGWMTVTPLGLSVIIPEGTLDALERYVIEAEKKPFQVPAVSAAGKGAGMEKGYRMEMVCDGNKCAMVKRPIDDKRAATAMELSKLLAAKAASRAT